MSRFPAYSRRTLRTRFRTWLATNRWLVAGLTLGAVVLLSLETALLLMGGAGPMEWYLMGALHTAVVAALMWGLHSAFLAHDREAIRHMRGAWGEENTRSELQRARRKGLIWGWVDSLTLQSGDIDHLVVTRSGGLLAIDSKWRNSTSANDRGEMARAAHTVRRRAEGVVDTLLKRDRGHHRASGRGHRVTPLLVLWGAEQHAVPDGARIDGIEVLGGRRLLRWLKDLDGERIDKDAAHDLLNRLEDFRAGAWESAERARERS